MIRKFDFPKREYVSIQWLLKKLYVRSGNGVTCIGPVNGDLIFHTDQSLALGLFDLLTFFDKNEGAFLYYTQVYNHFRDHIREYKDCFVLDDPPFLIILEYDKFDDALQAALDHFNFSKHGRIRIGPESGHSCRELTGR